MTGTEACLLSELLFISSASLGWMCPQQSDEGQSLFGFSSTEIGGTEDSAVDLCREGRREMER